MSQRCPRCRLFSPASALRCDCGYDFATQTMKGSFVEAERERKHGGRSNLLRASANDNLRHGLLITLILALVSALATLLTGQGFVVFPLVGAWGLILIIRAFRQRRQARSSR